MQHTDMDSFKDMPESSKVWIFQSERKLNDDEVNFIEQNGELFISQWTSHEQKMNAKLKVLHKLFVVVCLDESIAGASGCGIDKLTAFVKNIGNKLNVDFFNRLKIAIENNGEIEIINYHSLDKEILNGAINSESLVFENHSVQNLGDFKNHWKKQLKNSWLKDILNQPHKV